MGSGISVAGVDKPEFALLRAGDLGAVRKLRVRVHPTSSSKRSTKTGIALIRGMPE